MENLAVLRSLIARHAPGDGTFQTAIANVGLVRSASVTEPVHTFYEPSFCLVAGGRKRATIGRTEHTYDRASFLVIGVDVPVIGAVIEASPADPFLCFRLNLDRAMLAELMLTMKDENGPASGPAIGLVRANSELIAAAVRLMRLLDTPDDIAILSPLIEREILYRLMTGPQGAILRQIANSESRLSQVARAIGFIQQNYMTAFGINELAAIAGMSPSSFYEHFRAATAMSPLQFRTLLRLHEARRLMVMESMTAAEAGFRVGYESPSQFSRDYVRVYRVSPRRDIAAIRQPVSA